MGWTRKTLMAALLCAAGCQHDPRIRAVDLRETGGASPGAVDGFVIESDTRQVYLQLKTPPASYAIDGDMVFVYLSLPLHPLRGIEFDRPSVGAGWSNTAMYFTKVIEPFPHFTSNGGGLGWEPRDTGVEPALDPRPRPWRPPGAESTSVDAQYAEYAAGLRESIYRSGETPAGPVVARSAEAVAPVPPAGAGEAAAEDD